MTEAESGQRRPSRTVSEGRKTGAVRNDAWAYQELVSKRLEENMGFGTISHSTSMAVIPNLSFAVDSQKSFRGSPGTP